MLCLKLETQHTILSDTFISYFQYVQIEENQPLYSLNFRPGATEGFSVWRSAGSPPKGRGCTFCPGGSSRRGHARCRFLSRNQLAWHASQRPSANNARVPSALRPSSLPAQVPCLRPSAPPAAYGRTGEHIPVPWANSW